MRMTVRFRIRIGIRILNIITDINSMQRVRARTIQFKSLLFYDCSYDNQVDLEKECTFTREGRREVKNRE
jgi:hypothetical protein